MDIKRLDYNYDNSKMGTVKISYKKLIKMFGPPTPEEGEKINMFWAFKIGELKFSIHDYGQDDMNPNYITTWSVGSYSGSHVSKDEEPIYVGGLLSNKGSIEKGMIYMTFNKEKLEGFPPHMVMLYVE